jgi:hypothetical protein
MARVVDRTGVEARNERRSTAADAENDRALRMQQALRSTWYGGYGCEVVDTRPPASREYLLNQLIM